MNNKLICCAECGSCPACGGPTCNDEEQHENDCKFEEWMKESMIQYFDHGGSLTFKRDDEVLGPRECYVATDDPELDCTDFCHPAWWRGQDSLESRFIKLKKENAQLKDQLGEIIKRLSSFWREEKDKGPDERMGDGSPDVINECIAIFYDVIDGEKQ